MGWLMVALIPIVICGAMMLGGVVLAALGLRRVGNRARHANIDIFARD